MSTFSSVSKSEALDEADEAGDLPHPARKNVSGFRPHNIIAPYLIFCGAC